MSSVGCVCFALLIFVASGGYRKDNTKVVKPVSAPAAAVGSLSGTAALPIGAGAPAPVGDAPSGAGEPAFSAGPEAAKSRGSEGAAIGNYSHADPMAAPSSSASASGISAAPTEGSALTHSTAAVQGNAGTQGITSTSSIGLPGASDSRQACARLLQWCQQ